MRWSEWSKSTPRQMFRHYPCREALFYQPSRLTITSAQACCRTRSAAPQLYMKRTNRTARSCSTREGTSFQAQHRAGTIHVRCYVQGRQKAYRCKLGARSPGGNSNPPMSGCPYTNGPLAVPTIRAAVHRPDSRILGSPAITCFSSLGAWDTNEMHLTYSQPCKRANQPTRPDPLNGVHAAAWTSSCTLRQPLPYRSGQGTPWPASPSPQAGFRRPRFLRHGPSRGCALLMQEGRGTVLIATT